MVEHSLRHSSKNLSDGREQSSRRCLSSRLLYSDEERSDEPELTKSLLNEIDYKKKMHKLSAIERNFDKRKLFEEDRNR